MRFAGLLVLAFLLPAFAYAALININTADATLLDTLPGIGPSKAQAIITYRNEHGPFAKIEDIENVSGIGPSTFSDIKSLITVGAAIEPAAPDVATSTSATTTVTTATPVSGGSSPPEYIPIPILKIVTNGDRTVSSGAATAFTAVVYDGKGNKRDDALVTWSFGDGMRRVGASIFHQYYGPGEYLAVVHAMTGDGGDATREMVVTVKDAGIKIGSVSPRGVTLINSDSRTLDVSLWRIVMGGKEFKIPEDTQILAGRTILFPSQVIQLPIAGAASLLYPSGEVAATFPALLPASNGQLSVPQTSFNTVQTAAPQTQSGRGADQSVGSAISIAKNIPAYEEINAPTAANGLAAVGAAPPTGAADQPKSGSLFKSPWFMGLIGVVLISGIAFIFI